MKSIRKTMYLVIATIVMLQANEAALHQDEVTFNMRDTSIKDFIKTIAKITHKNILVDSDVNGKINFIAQEPIAKKDILPLANAILATKGLSIVDEGAFYKVVKASHAAAEGVDVSKQIDNETVTTVLFPLKKENAAVIRAKIKPLLGQHDKVISFKESNMLAVTAKPRTLRSVQKLIDALEGKSPKVSTVIRLKYANAKEVYPNIANMSKKLFPQTVESERVDVFKDEATNALILVGKSDNIRRLIRYVKQLDIKSDDQVQRMYVIRLKNSNVEEMEKILSKLVAQMNDIAQRRTKKGKPIKKAMVVSDVERNALIVLATGEQIRNIKETIRQIDIPKVQVYVKARIVEIDKNLAQQLGLKYGINGGAITTNGLFTLNANLGASALQMSPNLLSFLNTNSTKRIPDGNGGYIIENDPAFTFGNVDKVFALGAQLDFLRKHGAAHILSEPSILCTNNKEAEIYVGQTRSILTQAQQSPQGNSNIVNTYSREDIGLTLKVKPRLSSDNKVTLEVETTIEDVLDNESPAADRPTTTKRNVKTTAIVNNGETIILGGLIKRAGGKGTTKLPLLGDIPVLGELLFKHTSDLHRETNVVIYLTPYIVRKSDDLEKLKDFLEELEKVQSEYDAIVFQRIEKGKRHIKTSPSARIVHRYKRQKSGLDLTSEF